MLTLSFNESAVTAMGNPARLRLFTKLRGGVVYVALRPSYRVAGKNVQLMVTPVEGDTSCTAELTAEHIQSVDGLPEIKANTSFALEDIGYGWFVLKEPTADAVDGPTVSVLKARKTATPVVTQTANTTIAEQATTDAAPEAAAASPKRTRTKKVTVDA